MSIQSDATLKGYFQTGDFPSESNFTDLIDSKLSKTATSTTQVDTIVEETLDNGVKIENIIHKDNVIAQGAAQTEGFVMRHYEIGSWNMYVSGGGTATATTTVVLDGALKFPESVNVGIIADGETGIRNLERVTSGVEGGRWKTDSNGDIEIEVATGGPFDSASYDGASNRGHVVVTKWSAL